MRIAIIGATGHVGGYLVPRLVEEGHDVVAITRGTSAPYRDHPAWKSIEHVIADREAEDAAGTFASRVAALEADVVVDLICFTPDSARQLVGALRGRVRQLVHVGTIWTHGTLTEVPAPEDAVKRPWGEYGVQKEAIERLLLAESRRENGLPVAIVHPGHISGPGWPVITPQGTVDLEVWRTLATGRELLLPGFGLETVHHVHADDVAQLIRLCLEHPAEANGRHSTPSRSARSRCADSRRRRRGGSGTRHGCAWCRSRSSVPLLAKSIATPRISMSPAAIR